MRNAVGEHMAEEYGPGPWCSPATEKGVLRGISNTSRVLLARSGRALVGSLRLAQKKPWAIDVKYFTPAATRALYLVDMAVTPRRQRKGVGRALLQEAIEVAREWPADAIRLDAYDAPAGAGPFYAKCGYREVGRVTYRKTPLVYYEIVQAQS